MSANATSTNPVVQAIVAGTAPKGARMAAARGMLPLDQADMLEALVALRESDDVTVASAAEETLSSQEPEKLLHVASSAEIAPSVLGYLATRSNLGREVHEAVTLNGRTPDEAIALLAGITTDGSLLELITVNQQRLIRAPSIIEAKPASLFKPCAIPCEPGSLDALGRRRPQDLRLNGGHPLVV